jgi:cytoskeletal protein RodZ
MSIGKQLRQAREAQAISLDQAAQATHIRLHYLEALEANQFDLLPSVAQMRGFLRAYGDYLKLNSSELVHSLAGEWKLNSEVTKPALDLEEMTPALTSSDAIFKEIGKKLCSQRELMGLSLGDVERHTHIRIHYVRALEEGDISHLPSPVQGRGMLSNYASFLGLNTEDVLLRFADGLQASLYDRQASRNPSKSKPRLSETTRVPARPSQLRRLFSMDLFAGGFLIIFLLGFTIWGALHISALRSRQAPSPTAPPVSEILLSTASDNVSATLTLMPTGVLSTVATAIVDAALVPGTVETNQTETPAVLEATPGLGTEPIQVYIIAHQRAWMRITVDGEIAFEGRVMPGSAYTFAGNERVEFLTGDGGGLQVYFNQQDLGILGSFGEVVERIFSIQGVQTATPSVPLTSTPLPTRTVTPTPTSTRTSVPGTPSPTPKP